MQVNEMQEKRPFQLAFEEEYLALKSSEPLKKVRHRAWDHFLELGLPHRKLEAFRKVPLRRLFTEQYRQSQTFVELKKEDIASYRLPESSNSCLVFVNGCYRKDLSFKEGMDPTVEVMSLDRAMKEYSSLLMNSLAKSVKTDADAFSVLNTALHQDGIFCYIPSKVVLETPIQILNLITLDEDFKHLMPRVQFFCAKGSESTIVSTVESLKGANYLFNYAFHISLEEAARCRFIHWGKEDEESWTFAAFRAQLKRDAHFESVVETSGSQTVRHDYHVQLMDENANALLNGLSRLKGRSQAHNHILMHHQAPHCYSSQLFKAVLEDVSRSSFKGKIWVDSRAQKTDAFQLNNHLVLSDQAIAYSKPNLEILADDVKASHGATVGQLDEKQLYYLQSRGISHEQACLMLIKGFVGEILDKITLDSIKEALI